MCLKCIMILVYLCGIVIFVFKNTIKKMYDNKNIPQNTKKIRLFVLFFCFFLFVIYFVANIWMPMILLWDSILHMLSDFVFQFGMHGCHMKIVFFFVRFCILLCWMIRLQAHKNKCNKMKTLIFFFEKKGCYDNNERWSALRYKWNQSCCW